LEDEKTKSGIILTNKNTDENSQKPRWGKVFAVGPDVKDVKEGDYILIAPLRWTLGFKFDNIELSKTIEKEILIKAIHRCNGIKKRAAKLLGITFRSMRYRVEKYGLSGPGDEELVD
jgi:co-chaperonin GroES (HSP10)